MTYARSIIRVVFRIKSKAFLWVIAAGKLTVCATLIDGCATRNLNPFENRVTESATRGASGLDAHAVSMLAATCLKGQKGVSVCTKMAAAAFLNSLLAKSTNYDAKLEVSPDGLIYLDLVSKFLDIKRRGATVANPELHGVESFWYLLLGNIARYGFATTPQWEREKALPFVDAVRAYPSARDAYLASPVESRGDPALEVNKLFGLSGAPTFVNPKTVAVKLPWDEQSRTLSEALATWKQREFVCEHGADPQTQLGRHRNLLESAARSIQSGIPVPVTVNYDYVTREAKIEARKLDITNAHAMLLFDVAGAVYNSSGQFIRGVSWGELYTVTSAELRFFKMNSFRFLDSRLTSENGIVFADTEYLFQPMQGTKKPFCWLISALIPEGA